MMKWLVLLALARVAGAQTPMQYIHNGPESPDGASRASCLPPPATSR
jgi:hypothetical protein